MTSSLSVVSVPPVSVELSVFFEGTEPGLAEHRLSLSAFGEPLRLLMIALQRTASAILSSSNDPEYGGKGGQYKAEARMLDLEVRAVGSAHADAGGSASAGVVFACVARVPSGGQLTIAHSAPGGFERFDLPAIALRRLLEDIDAERIGKARNASVRRYLASIPERVSRQRYLARCGEEILGDIVIESDP